MNAAAIWRTTLERLETEPLDEVSKAWLQSAHLADAPNIGADDIDAASLPLEDQAIYFTLQVPGSLVRDVISTRWRRSIEDILMDVTGQPVAITVIDHVDDSFAGSQMHQRTSSQAGGFLMRSFEGNARIVRMFEVTSSPAVPSPRVAPRT